MNQLIFMTVMQILSFGLLILCIILLIKIVLWIKNKK